MCRNYDVAVTIVVVYQQQEREENKRTRMHNDIISSLCIEILLAVDFFSQL
jgi:hypothetical protein